jgi:hypothetical protein
VVEARGRSKTVMMANFMLMEEEAEEVEEAESEVAARYRTENIG